MADDDAKQNAEDGAAEKPKRKTSARRRKKASTKKADEPRPFCGLVMPISPIAGRDEAHWKRVRSILAESLDKAGFDSDLVSNSDEVTVIHSNIVENLYDNAIVVCDVSGKNPNVMLELGMRLAFDKSVVIVKDDDTEYSFDSAPIEHIQYPRSLRYDAIVDFKKKLAEKVGATHAAGKNDPKYSPFLKHFKRYTSAGIQTETVDGGELTTRLLEGISRQLLEIRQKFPRADSTSGFSLSDRLEKRVLKCIIGWVRAELEVLSMVYEWDDPEFHDHIYQSAKPDLNSLQIDLPRSLALEMIAREVRRQTGN